MIETTLSNLSRGDRFRFNHEPPAVSRTMSEDGNANRYPKSDGPPIKFKYGADQGVLLIISGDMIDFLETVKDTVQVEMPTVSGINPRVFNTDQRYSTMGYFDIGGFYISMKGNNMSPGDAAIYLKHTEKLIHIATGLNLMLANMKHKNNHLVA